MFTFLLKGGWQWYVFTRSENEDVENKIKILFQQTPYYNERHGKFMAHFYAITLFVFLIFSLRKRFDNAILVVFFHHPYSRYGE